jgi:hypothetical protein
VDPLDAEFERISEDIVQPMIRYMIQNPKSKMTDNVHGKIQGF